MKKIINVLSLTLVTIFAFTACAKPAEVTKTAEPAASTSAEKPAEEKPTTAKKDLKIGVVLTNSGRGDKSFNDSALKGIEDATKDFGVKFKEVQPKDMAQIESSIEFLAKENYNLIFTIGFTSAKALETVAPKYPDINFAIIDYDFGDAIAPNVKSLVFTEEQGSYLAGILAAELSTSNVVGFIGGMESDLIKKFEVGFVTGAKSVKPDAEVMVAYVSAEPSGFNNPSKAKEIALNMISKKADVLYHAAGASGQGLLEAVDEKGVLAIGVDSNQNWVKPGAVVASMIKCVDNAVYEVISKDIDGTLEMGNTQVYDLAAGGVKLSDLTELEVEETVGISDADQAKIKEAKSKITEEIKAKIAAAEKDIISGTVVVPTK